LSTLRRARVRWSARRRRPWCPGAIARTSTPPRIEPSIVRTAYVRWQAVLDALRGVRSSPDAPPEPAAPLPGRSVPGPTHAPVGDAARDSSRS